MIGEEIGGFILKYKLGEGGMAEVWYAENKIGKRAAVKLLLSKFCQDDAIVARFQNEAKVMVQLDHPNIRQVNDYGTIDGRPAIIMEYLEGDDLKALMKDGRRFTDDELRKWWNQMVDALNYTHSMGIVHRDIKPSNIFIDRRGNVRLLDFGIAKIKEGFSMTQTGAMMGTLMYMSPEQVRDSKHIDYRTDVYSLAVTFVHLLTGRAPYDTNTSDDYTIRKGIVELPLDMTGVPASWRQFLEPYLAKDPQQRPALVQFGGQQATVAAEPVVEKTVHNSSEETFVADAKPSTVTSPAPKPAKDRKNRKGLWIGVGVIAVIGIIVAIFFLTNGKGSHNDNDYVDLGSPSGTKPSAEASILSTDYVDLGLPSGTLWKNENESGLYDYDAAVKEFGSKLPTKEQLEELKNSCQWTWTGDGYKVTGPNGNFIVLPAAGWRGCNGDVFDVGSGGAYWSSTPYGSDNAWYLDLSSREVGMYNFYRCFGFSVRLVQD